MKKFSICLALLWAISVCPVTAYDDIYCSEGLGRSPFYGVPTFIPTDSHELSFDWTLSFWGMGPGGTSAGIDEGLELLRVSDVDPSSSFRLWTSAEYTAATGDPVPPDQFGHTLVDLSAFQGTTVRLAFHIWYTRADMRDDSSAFISNIQLVSAPEPGTASLVGLFLGGLLVFNRSKRGRKHLQARP